MQKNIPETLKPNTISELIKLPVGSRVEIVGHISDISVSKTMRGDEMAFLEIQDDEGWIKAIVFPEGDKDLKETLCELAKNRRATFRGILDWGMTCLNINLESIEAV